MVHVSDLVAAEATLGVALPEDYRDFLKASNGMEESMPDAHLVLWPLATVVDVSTSDAYGFASEVPGLLLIGTDGGGELLGLDVRSSPAPVVMVNAITASWAEVSVQAESISRLIAQLRDGGSFTLE